MFKIRSTRRYMKRFTLFICSILTISTLYCTFVYISNWLCIYCPDKLDTAKLFHINWESEQRLSELGINTSFEFSNLACVHPVLEVWHPDLQEYFQEPTPLKCSPEQDWIVVKNGTFNISPDAIKRHGEISCEYLPQRRGMNDFSVVNGISIRPMEDGDNIRSDFFRATCIAADGSQYSNLHLGIAINNRIHNRFRTLPQKQKNREKLNILMFGLDSTSRMSWLRNMPESHKYFTTELGGVVMEGYNIVGDGTPQALLPILTGYDEQVLPEVRRGQPNAQHVDGHPWIWKDLKEHGYVTQWGEDGAAFGTFTLRMLGFKDQPVDHYLRTFYLLAEMEYQNHPPYCLGSTPRHMNMLNWIRDLYEMYQKQPKFTFMFHSEYTHDGYSQVNVLDGDLLKFLKHFESSGYLNNTMLILMADHGARFQQVRHTVQGKYEERLPFMAFRLPPWFAKQHPKKMRNLFLNSKRLTTPYDIHATFRDILQMGSATKLPKQHMDKYGAPLGISLLDLIPAQRTCDDAKIDAHWCACLKWKAIKIGNKHVQASANQLVASINSLTYPKYHLCHRIELVKVLNAVTYTPNSNLLKFKSSKDADGRIPDLSDDMIASEVFYQVTIVVSPGGGMFEATVRHSLKDDKFHASDHEISRINRYGNQPHCIQRESPHLRQFCYCKVQLDSNS